MYTMLRTRALGQKNNLAKEGIRQYFDSNYASPPQSVPFIKESKAKQGHGLR